MFKVAITAALLLTACPAPPTTCELYGSHFYHNDFPGQYHYDVKPDVVTEAGVSVDTSGLKLDTADLLDRQLEEVEQCLAETFPGGKLPESMLNNCDSTHFPLPIAHECLEVKVAPDWIPSLNDPDQQLLRAPGDVNICVAKGACATAEECQCHLRSGIQDNHTIVVTPTFYLFKASLVRLVTGCNNPWIQGLEKCSTPTVSSTSQ